MEQPCSCRNVHFVIGNSIMWNFPHVLSYAYFFTGDHIRSVGISYSHHMLVVEVVDGGRLRVIHYTTNADKESCASGINETVLAVTAACPALGSAGEVKEEVISVDLTKETYHKLDYPPGVALHTGIDAIIRARWKLKEKEYSGYSNNCESLVNWAITEKNQTNQGDTASRVVGGVLTVGVVGAIAYGIVSVLSGRKNNSD